MKQTFAGKIRAAAKTLPKAGFTSGELSDAAGLTDYKQRDVMRRTITDMLTRGEMKRIDHGVYAYVGRTAAQPQKQPIMWHYLRSSKSFGGVTLEELQEVARADVTYVREWLNLLVRHEMVRQTGEKYQLTSDPVEMPQNDEKAERLRAIREKKKQKIATALTRARSAIEDALTFLGGEQ